MKTFPGMFEDIPRNVWRYSPECFTTFPGMFDDIHRNITFPPLPAFPELRSPFPVPVFLVLYIALLFMPTF